MSRPRGKETKPDVVVTINGRKVAVDAFVRLSYRDIVNLAKCSAVQPTVTVAHRVAHGQSGRSITPGDSMIPLAGMIINVADTSRA